MLACLKTDGFRVLDLAPSSAALPDRLRDFERNGKRSSPL